MSRVIRANPKRAGAPVPARVRLLMAGVTMRDVARAADVHESMVGHVFAGRREGGDARARVIQAAELLSGLPWAALSAPLNAPTNAAA